MLSEDDKNRIRLEEEQKAQDRAEALEQATRTKASLEYRKQVRAELISRRRNMFWWTIPILILTGIGAYFISRPSAPERFASHFPRARRIHSANQRLERWETLGCLGDLSDFTRSESCRIQLPVHTANRFARG